MLPIAGGLGLSRVLVAADASNTASRRAIEANRGILAGEEATVDHDCGRKLLFWIATST